MKKEQPIPRTFGGNISKRTNKKKSPSKFDMWQYITDRGAKYMFDTSHNTIKKVFSEMGGNEWWNNKTNKKG